MPIDRARLSRIRAEQDRALRAYLRYEVAAYSPFYQPTIDAVASRGGPLTKRADLARLPLTDLERVEDPAALVLRPDPDRIRRRGPLGLRLRAAFVSLTGQSPRFAQTRIDPAYKPVHWMLTGDGFPVGSSVADLDLLADVGRRWLEQAGVRPHDVLVSIVPPGPNLAFWQLQLGARRGGVSTLMLPEAADPASVVPLRPTVLAGRPDDLVRFFEQVAAAGQGLHGLHTVLTAGEPVDDGRRSRLQQLAADLGGEEPAVVAAWAPPGARAMWAECRGGNGFHTWPHAEVIEIVDGAVVWTALHWRGTVLVRLRTGVPATLDEAVCPTCGRSTPRLVFTPGPAA